MSDIANWISAGSLLVSIIAIFISAMANRKANAMQRRIVEIEEQREKDKQELRLSAILPVQLRKDRNNYRLYIVNGGEAEARNVRVLIDSRPLSQLPVYVQNDKMPPLVGPRSEVSCALAINLGYGPPFDVEVLWDDDSGTENKYRTTVTF